MKFRLPLLLRTAVLSCCAAVAPLASTFATGSLFTAAAVAFSLPLASAAELSKDVTLDNSSSVSKTVDEVNEGIVTDPKYGMITADSQKIDVKNCTMTVKATEDKSLSKWSGLSIQGKSVAGDNFSFENVTLSGDGNFALAFRNGGGTAQSTSANLTFNESSTFTGRILLVNVFNNSCTANYGGGVLKNAEIVFAKNGEDYSIGGDLVRCGTNRFTYNLNLTGDANLSGISGEAASGDAKTPGIVANADNTTLTLTGGCTTNTTYSFAGNVGASDRTINLAMTGGNQTFSGTNYLGMVNVSGGSLTLGGTTTAMGKMAVGEGASLTLSGKLVLPSDFTGIANGGTLTISDGAKLDVSALLSTVDVTEGTNGSITLVTGNGTVNSGSITEWDSIITSGKIGLTWTYSNGVLSYTSTLHELTYSSETALTWTNDATGFDGDKSFSAGDMVTFTGETAVTLGGAITSAKVTIAKNADITLTGNGNKLTAGNMVLNGTLTLKDDALASGTKFDASGTGTLKIDVGGNGEFYSAVSVSDFQGTLQIASGRFKFDQTVRASTIKVNGGQLWVYASEPNANAINLSGTGWEGDGTNSVGKAAIRLANAGNSINTVTLSGTIKANDGVEICVFSSTERGIISGVLEGSGTLTKTGQGTLEISGTGSGDTPGNITHTGKMIVADGVLQIGKSYTNFNTIAFERIEVQSGAELHFHHGTASFSDTEIVLNGGLLYHALNSPNSELTFGTVTVGTDSKIRLRKERPNNKVHISTLNLSASLTVSDQDGNAHSGLIVTNTKVSNNTDTPVTLSGKITTANFSKTKEGSFALAEGASLTITGKLEMNYKGGLDFSGGTLTLNDGATLNYTVANGVIAGTEAGISLLDADDDTDTTAANLIEITSANMATDATVSISISSDLRRTAGTINLGILKTGDQAVTEDRITLSNTLTLAGWKLDKDDTEATHWALVKGTAAELNWDSAWNISSGNQPVNVKSADLEVSAGTPYEAPYYSDSGGSGSVFFSVATSTDPSYTGTYPDGKAYTAINLQGEGNANLIVCGGKVVVDGGGTGESLTSDTWINAATGKYKALVGGNYANNWNGSGAMNLIGDTHIQVTGATVGTIIGGNYKDGKDATHTGNSYITVADRGNVTGAIIGAGLVAHNATPSMKGNTNIFIYTTLNDNSSTLNNEAPHMVVGGFAYGDNVAFNATLEGNTNITVDFTETTEDGASFGKHIVGGNANMGEYDENYAGRGTQTIVGNTNVTLKLCDASMGGYMAVGGSWVKGNGDGQTISTITGTSTMTVESGMFGHVISGSYVNGGNCTASVGNTVLQLNGGSFNNVVGASAVGSGSSGTLKIGTTGEDGNFTAGTSKVTISGTALVGWTMIGGFWLDGSDGEITAELGDIEVNINGGTVSDISGGTFSARDDGSVTQGDITVNLKDGKVNGWVYAAGEQRGNAGITTRSTTVNIGTDVNIENTQVFGGYWVGRDENDGNNVTYASKVTGDRTLNFTDAGEYTNITNQNGFYDFDVVNVKEETGKVTLNNGIQKKWDKEAAEQTGDTLSFISFKKTGAGTLVLKDAKQDVITVSAGTLSMVTGGNNATSVVVADRATLSLGSSGSNTLTAVTVNTGGTLDATAGGTSVGGSLALRSGSTLALGEAALNLNGTLTINHGLMLSTTKDLRGVRKVNMLLADGITQCTLCGDGIATPEDVPMLLADGISQCTLGGDGTATLEDGHTSLAADSLTSFTANGTNIDLDTLVLYYGNGELRLMTDLSLLGDYYSDTLGETGNAGVGTAMADEVLSTHPVTGTPLANVLERMDDLIDAGNLSAARKLAASLAGSTVTALGHAQKNALRDLMGTIRDRMGTLGVNDLVVNDDLPNFHLWALGNTNYAKLDSKRDQAGYTLNTYGGTVGADADFTENVSAGIAFTAAWGDLDAQAAETATGDLDGYYLSLYAQAKGTRQTHKLILTGATFDATLNRTVSYGTGNYRANGSTNGSGFGAMYEGSYDFYLNEDRDAFFRPWVNLSVVHSQTDAYTETGEADNAALRIGKQEMTTATFAAGVSFAGAMSENLLGRPVWGEFRAGVSQDAGDDRCTADVGFAGMSAYTGTLKGAKEGRTALQLGAGLNVPVGEQSNVYFNVNAAFRSHASSVSGSVGYRYDF